MAEYIKLEALKDFPIRKDRCDKERANEHFIFGIESVLEYAENLPAADVAPVAHWVLTDEKLPPDGQDVLCWYEYFRFGAFNRMYQTFGVGYQFNGNWGGEVVQGQKAKVLAWMPLPKPPKMEGYESGETN